MAQWWHRLTRLPPRTLFVGGLVISFGMGMGAGAYRHLLSTLPSISQLEQWRPKQTTIIYARDGSILHQFSVERRIVLPLREISPQLVQAVIAIEDQRFYEHGAFDWKRILGALLEDLLTLSLKEGGSTITQQLARTLFLTPQKTIPRKAKEAILALEIERSYRKDEILELYLNQIYFGSGAYGVEAAAQTYFGKSVRELSLPEMALIAGLLPAPGRYSPFINPPEAIRRRNLVLQAMVKAGYLSAGEADAARRAPLPLAGTPGSRRLGAYFVEVVRQELQRRFGEEAIYQEGLRVYSTLDPSLQKVAEEALERQLQVVEHDSRFHHLKKEDYARLPEPQGGWVHDPQRETPYLQGAVVVMEVETGDVLALMGGRDFERSQFNRATQALRQPGSAFKPFVYAAAVENGIPASFVIRDSPITIIQPDSTIWEPRNYDEQFRGPLVLREGLRHSVNLVSIKLLQKIGASTVAQYARRLGLTSSLPPYESLAVGAAEVSLLELVSAYSSFAGLGLRSLPRFITRVEDAQGQVWLEIPPQRERVLTSQSAYIMVSLLQDVIDRGTGAGARRLGFDHPAGGKTGTTNEFTDASFIGFTPELVAGVWVGFDQAQTIMDQGVGATVALPAWVEVMRAAAEDRPSVDFAVPPGLTTREVCRRSGLLPNPFCPVEDLYTEIFMPGTEPTQSCDVHGPEKLWRTIF